LNLKWEDVDFQNRAIVIRAENSKNGKQEYLEMPEVLTTVLKDLKCTRRSEYVFTNRDGNHYRDIRAAHRAALRWAGILESDRKELERISGLAERVAAEKRNSVTFHSVRHTFATMLAMTSKDLMRVKQALRHADIATTMQYAHSCEDGRREAVEGVESLLAEKPEINVEKRVEVVDLDDVRKNSVSRKADIKRLFENRPHSSGG